MEGAQTKLQIRQCVPASLASAERNHFLRVIHGDNASTPARQQLTQQSLPRAEIRDVEWRDNPKQELSERLPGTPRAVAPIKPTRHLVEVELRLVVTRFDNASQVRSIGIELRQFLGRSPRKLHEFLGLAARKVAGEANTGWLAGGRIAAFRRGLQSELRPVLRPDAFDAFDFDMALATMTEIAEALRPLLPTA